MRAIGIPDDVYSGGLGVLATGALSVSITGSVNAGELVTLFESGVIKRTDPSQPWSAINQNQSTATTITETTSVGNIDMTTMLISNGCGFSEQLPIGDYIVPMQTSGGVGFCLRNSAGLQKTNFILVSVDVSTVAPFALSLGNGSFSIFWHVSGSLKHAVYDGNGNAICSPVTIDTNCQTSGQGPWHAHCAFSDYHFQVCWSNTSGALRCAHYSALGIIIGSIVTIDAACQGVFHASHRCANDDFIHYCFDTATNRHKLYRISNANVRAWGPVYYSGCYAGQFSYPDAPHIHPFHNRFFELQDYRGPAYQQGNICAMLPDSSGYCLPHLFNHLGSFVKKCDFGQNYHDHLIGHPACVTPYGFAICHHLAAEPNTYVTFCDFQGNFLSQNTIIDVTAHTFAANITPSVAAYIGWAGTGLAIVRYASYGGSCEIRGMQCDHLGKLIGTPTEYQPFGPGDCNSPVPICGEDGSIFPCWFSTATTTITVTYQSLGRSSVFGVAQAAATDGESVNVVSSGYFTLPPTQTFGSASAFDQRAQPVVGVRGVVGGNAAVLFGWE